MQLQIQIWDKTFNHPRQESNSITYLISIGSKAIFGIHLNHHLGQAFNHPKTAISSNIYLEHVKILIF